MLFILFLHFFIFRFFQIIMVSLFLARHDQHFIMFKDLSIFNFQFTNFPSKTKYDNTVVITYSQAENKKKIVEKILWLNLLEAFFFTVYWPYLWKLESFSPWLWNFIRGKKINPNVTQYFKLNKSITSVYNGIQ